MELPRPWRGRWAKVATLLMERGLGTAIAYRPPGGEVRLNPPGTEEIEAEAIYVILREEREAEVQALAAMLAGA